MMNQRQTNKRTSKGPYRFVDIKQPEVKLTIIISILLELFFIVISFYNNFAIFENTVLSLIECIIAGLISLIGIAIAGVAIVITMYSSDQIRLLDELCPKSFGDLLYDFKWFALISTFEVSIFIALIFAIKSPQPVVTIYAFYILVFIFIYAVFYLLFYGCALIGNCIKMTQIKCTLDTILMNQKSIPVSAIELQLDYLLSRLYSDDKNSAHEFYRSFIELIERSQIDRKQDILEYLKNRYSSF